MSERNYNGKYFNLRRLKDVRHYVKGNFEVYSTRRQIVILGYLNLQGLDELGV
jgi:hypothetical protein